MGLQYQLETPDATYYVEIYESVTPGKACVHFAFDCSCGEKQGSTYKNAGKSTINTFNRYQPYHAEKLAHTFYMNDELISTFLDDQHNEEQEDRPLVIVCNACAREFPFTYQTYSTLVEQIYDKGRTTEIPD